VSHSLLDRGHSLRVWVGTYRDSEIAIHTAESGVGGDQPPHSCPPHACLACSAYPARNCHIGPLSNPPVYLLSLPRLLQSMMMAMSSWQTWLGRWWSG
jgi:hypothetical protein